MRLLFITACYIAIGILKTAGQTHIIHGRVSNSENTPIANASILVKNSKLGTISATNGSFSITIPTTADTLLITAINFEDKLVLIGTKNTIAIVLEQNIQNLQEVIQVGYGTQKKIITAGCVAKLNGAEIENVPMTSADKMLQGKIAGLQSVSFNGQPGSDQQIRIRGITSYSANAQPLYVIDGVQINSDDLSANTSSSNTLSAVNANDIEDITVLKDAAATAIYGARGSNGVILITTKKGKQGKTQLRFDAEAGQTKYANLADAGKPLRTADWFTLLHEGMVNAGYPDATTNATMASYGYGNGVDIDWINLTTRIGTQRQYNISMTAGNDKTQVFLSGGYFKQQGANIGSALTRGSGNIQLTHIISPKLTVSGNLNIGSVYQTSPPSGTGYFGNPLYVALTLRPTQNPYNPDGTLNIANNNLGFPTHYNILYINEHDKIWLKAIQAIGGGSLEYKLLKGLKFTSHIGIQYNTLEEFAFNNPFHGIGKGSNGLSTNYYTRYFLWDWYNQFDYHINILKNNDLTADFKFGHEAVDNSYFRQASIAQNYPPTAELPYSINAATATTATVTAQDYSFASLYSTGSFTYKNKYTFYTSLRNDGSSRFGSANRFGNFVSAGASWNLMQENFMKDRRVFSGLKFRVSYGSAGNAGITNYGWRQLYSYGGNYNGAAGGTFNSIGNLNLTWEKTNQFNIGADISILKNRLTIVADIYNKESNGLLFDKPISQTTGFSTITSNVGKLQNKGWELALTAIPVSGKDFRWAIQFNIAHNTNKVLELPNNSDVTNGNFRLHVGKDIQSYFMRSSAGVDPATGLQMWYIDSTHKTTTSTYANAQLQFLNKTASPKYFGSFSNTFTYRNLSFTVDFYYNYGNYVQDIYGAYFTGALFPTRGKYAINLTRWQKPGDITTVAKYVYGQTSAAGDRLLYKGDYIRLRNVKIAYKVTTGNLLAKLGILSFNLYLRGTNLWTKTYDKTLPIDPEQGINAQDQQGLLISKTLTIGVTIDF